MKKTILTLLSATSLLLLSSCGQSSSAPSTTNHGRGITHSKPIKGCPNPSGPAQFTKAELKSSRRGWIKYGRLDAKGRATTANALITKNMIGKGSSANPNIRPAGFKSGKCNHARGHLIGRQLGGSGDTMKNLVTLYQNPVNTPYMTRYENEIRDVVESGTPVRYRVTPIYKAGQAMPVSIKMEAKSLNNRRIDYTVTIPNKP